MVKRQRRRHTLRMPTRVALTAFARPLNSDVRTPQGIASVRLAVVTERSYNGFMFSWDETKRRANIRKHGIDFADAEKVFRGFTLTAEDDREAYGERRFSTLGLLEDQVVAIAHTERMGSIRIISIRKATKREARFYFSEFTD